MLLYHNLNSGYKLLGSLKFLKYRLYYLHSTYMEMLNANFSC